jgi:DNA mismatch endonuclease (patch repair protein)
MRRKHKTASTKAVRSRIMSQIRKTNTGPEIAVRKFLHAKGLRFRLYDRKLPGHPDIVLPKYSSIVLVNGCFWHQHPGCVHATSPRVNRSYWIGKLARNVQRDTENLAELRTLKWRVFIVWECEISRSRLERLHKGLIGRTKE